MRAREAKWLGADSQAGTGIDVAVDIEIAHPGEPGVPDDRGLIDAQFDAEARADVFAARGAALAWGFGQQDIAADGLHTEIHIGAAKQLHIDERTFTEICPGVVNPEMPTGVSQSGAKRIVL